MTGKKEASTGTVIDGDAAHRDDLFPYAGVNQSAGIREEEPPPPPGDGPVPAELCNPRFLFVSYLQGSIAGVVILLLLRALLASGTVPTQFAQFLELFPALLAIGVALLNTHLWSNIVFQVSGIQSAIVERGLAESNTQSSAVAAENRSIVPLLILTAAKAVLVLSFIVVLLSASSAEILSMLTGFTLFLFFGTFVLAFKSKKMMKASPVASAEVPPEKTAPGQ